MAEWKHNPKLGWGEVWECSNCGEKTTSTVMGYPRYNYCPMCGAKMADRKAESNSEKPNNCEDWHGDCKTCEWYDGTSCGIPCCDYEPKDEPTSSKMEQVDEPKTQMKTQNSNLTFEKADEPQTERSSE